MNLDSLTRRLMHLRKVALHIDDHLDAPLRLEELAEIAHLSRYHFLRVFADYAGELPQARVRRLRLALARMRLLSGEAGSLLNLALESGYGSAAAFSRAFRAAYGMPPSAVLALPETPLPIELIDLPATPIQFIPYSGDLDESLQPFDELRARAMHRGIPRSQRKGWCVHLEGEPGALTGRTTLRAALLSERLGGRVPGLDLGHLPAGQYAVLYLQGGYNAPDKEEIARRVRNETGLSLQEGPFLRSFENTTYLPARFERRCKLYVPVSRH